MKKLVIFLMITGLLWLFSCTADQPSSPTLDVTISQLALSKLVTVGNSLTAGFQSSGLSEDMQMHSYGYLIAKQINPNGEFEQPLISAPGIGSPAGKTPQSFDPATGAITQADLTVNPLTLLTNSQLERPYDNLGVPGADLNDVLNTNYGAESDSNSFFDIVLRNPNFGNTSQIEQAIMLRPTLMLLWIGNNDVLGAALAGGDLTQITDATEFQTNMTTLLTKIRTELPSTALVMANIPDVTDIPYVNVLDGVFLGGFPMIFSQDSTTLQFVAMDFGGGTYLPLITEESSVTHITLPGLLAYQAGLGIPDSTALRGAPYNLPDSLAHDVVTGLKAAGITPTGLPLPGGYTITADEEASITAAVDGFNSILAALAAPTAFQVPIVDANALLGTLNTSGLDGLSGKYVLNDPATTAFSLDGVHPNNAGYALVANAFIDVLNNLPAPLDGINITRLNAASYAGQYIGSAPKLTAKSAVENVKYLFVK